MTRLTRVLTQTAVLLIYLFLLYRAYPRIPHSASVIPSRRSCAGLQQQAGWQPWLAWQERRCRPRGVLCVAAGCPGQADAVSFGGCRLPCAFSQGLILISEIMRSLSPGPPAPLSCCRAHRREALLAQGAARALTVPGQAACTGLKKGPRRHSRACSTSSSS